MRKYYYNKESIEKKMTIFKKKLNSPCSEEEVLMVEAAISDLGKIRDFLVAKDPGDTTEVTFDQQLGKCMPIVLATQEIHSSLRVAARELDWLSLASYRKSFKDGYKIDDTIRMTDSFFQQLPDDYRNAYLKVKSKIKSNHLFYDASFCFHSCGFMFPVRCFTEVYTGTYRDGTIVDGSNFVHEIGHAVEFLLTGDEYALEQNNLFSEVVPIFFELINCEFLRTQGINDNEVNNLHLDIATVYFEPLVACDKAFRVYSLAQHLLGKSEKDIYRIIGKQAHISYNNVPKIIYDVDFFRNAKYAISYMAAIELFMIYLDNPNDALKILRFLTKRNLLGTEAILKSYNEVDLSLGDNVASYSKKLKKNSFL